MTTNQDNVKDQVTEGAEVKSAKTSKNTKVWLGASVAAASMFMMSNSNIAGVSADSTGGNNEGSAQDDSDAQAAVTAQGVDAGTQSANYENGTSTQTGYKTEHNTVNVNYSHAVSKDDAVKHFDGITKAASKYGAGTRVGKQTIGKAAGVKLNSATIYDEDQPVSVEKTDDRNATISLPVKATTGAKQDKVSIKLHANIAADKVADTPATEATAETSTTAVATTQAATPAVQAEAATPAVQPESATPAVQVTALKTAAPVAASANSLADLQAKTEAKAIDDYTAQHPDQENIQLDGETTKGTSSSLVDVPADLQAAGLFDDKATTSDEQTSYTDPTKNVTADTDVTLTGQQTFTDVDMVPGLPDGSYTSKTTTVPADTTPVFKDQLAAGTTPVATGDTAAVAGGSGLTQAAANALKNNFSDATVVPSKSQANDAISVVGSDSQQTVTTGDATTKGTFNANITMQITQSQVNSGAFDQVINPNSPKYNPELAAQIFKALSIQFNGVPAQGTYKTTPITINGKVYTSYYDIPAAAGGRHAIVVIDWNNYNGAFYTHHASMFEIDAGSDDQNFATGASNYGMDFRFSVQEPAKLFDVVRPTYTSTKQVTKITYTEYKYTTTTHEYTWFNAKATGTDKVVPVEPDAPLTPVTPDTPVEPDAPLTPVTPDTPVEPDAPLTPVTPDTPVEPDAPLTPVTPDTPVEPDAPLTPVTPDTPVEPDAPLTPVTPDTPVDPFAPYTPATPDTPVEPFAPVTPKGPDTPIIEVPGEPVTPIAPLTPFPGGETGKTPNEEVPVPPTSVIPQDITEIAPGTPKRVDTVGDATTPVKASTNAPTFTNLSTKTDTQAAATTPLANSGQKRLPQTGEAHSDSRLAALGVTLLGFLGLGAAKRRKKDDE